MLNIIWRDVTAISKGIYTFVQGFKDGKISIYCSDNENEVAFQKRVHSYGITAIAIIDECQQSVRIGSCDRSGRTIVFSVYWINAGEHNFAVDFEHTADGYICQITNLYPKYPVVCTISNTGKLLSLNWRSREIRHVKIFQNLNKSVDFGISYNSRGEVLYVSFLTKSGLKIMSVDSISLSLLNLFSSDCLPYFTPYHWTRQLWYCGRFIICYSNNFLIAYDPVSLTTLHISKLLPLEEILFIYSEFADVFIVKKTVKGEIVTELLSHEELLHVRLPEISPVEFPEVVEAEPEEFKESMRNSSNATNEELSIEPANVDAKTPSTESSSEESLPGLDPAHTYHPQLPEWIERQPETVPPVMMGQFASDSNITPAPVPEETTTVEEQSEDYSQLSGDHPTEHPLQSSPLRPAVSADDRLMRLFFPADYDNQCPFPGKLLSSDENFTGEDQPEVICEPIPVISDEECACPVIPDVNFLDYWPIWLDMPLAWTSLLSNSRSLLGALRPTSISLSRHHIYVTDTASRLSYAGLDCKTVRWEIAANATPANQVSVSPSGDILWLLRSGNVFAAQSVSASAPVGNRWERILLDVSYIHVCDGRAFYIRKSGALMMQSGLSGRRPSYISVQLHTPFRLKSVVVAGNDVWGQCVDGRVVFNNRILASSSAMTRSNIAVTRGDEAYVGEWGIDKYCPPDASRVVALYVGPFHTVVVADENCKIWLRKSSASPSCCLTDFMIPASKSKCLDEWWLVPMPNRSQDAMSESSSNKKTWPLYVASCRDTIILTAPSEATGNLQLYLSKGQLLGQQLRRIRPNGTALTTRWRSVHFVEPSRRSETDEDCKPRRSFSWLVGNTGDLLRLDFATLNAISPSPVELRAGNVKAVSVGQQVTWVLLGSGTIWVCHHESEVERWAQMDLGQLAEDFLPIIDIAVGPRLVWILSECGALFFRIGTGVISSNAASQPALCRLTDDDTSGASNVLLRRIYASSQNDWMVFALPALGEHNPKPLLRSSKHSATGYSMAPLARMGITADVPIGALWHPIIGGPEMADLALSAKAGLFGIPEHGRSSSCDGVVCWRAGVKPKDPTGSYWRRVVDGAEQVSVGDEHAQLCLVGTDGSLYVHAVCCLANGLNGNEEAPTRSRRRMKTETEKDLDEWEMV